MADATSPGVDIAGILSKLAPIFLGSGTTTNNQTDTTTQDTSPLATAENQAVFATALNNANNPDITDAVTQNILHNAALTFAPVLGEERSSGLYNTTVKQQLASEAQARATAEASQAALNFRTSQEQIASAAAGQLTAATKRSVGTANAAQRTSPVIPGKASASLLGGASAALAVPSAISNIKKLFTGSTAAKAGSDVSGFGPENNPELGGGRIGPDQLTDFASNPDNADVFSGNAVGSEGQFGDAISFGGQTDAASLAPADITTIADPVESVALTGSAGADVAAPAVDTAATIADTAPAVAAGADAVPAVADAATSFIPDSQAFIDVPQTYTFTGETGGPQTVTNPDFFPVSDFQGSNLSQDAIFNQEGQFLGSGSQELANPDIAGTLAPDATFTDTAGATFTDVSGSLVPVGADVAGASAADIAGATAGELSFAGAGADVAGAAAGDVAAGIGADAAAGAGADVAAGVGADLAASAGADAAGGALAASAAGDAGFSALDALAVLLSVSCTELYRQKKIPYLHYVASGVAFNGYSRAAKRAYWLWGRPAAKYIRRNPDKFLSRLLLWLLANRAEFLAAKAGVARAKKTFKGKLAQVVIATFTTILGVATFQFLEPKHG